MLLEVSNNSSLIKAPTNISSDLSGFWINFFSELMLEERTYSIVTYS